LLVVVVEVVPVVVVEVVPDVDVAVVDIMAVPEVSLIVPAGIAEVDVVALVSVAVVLVDIVEAVSVAVALVSVVLLLVSLLQAKPKTLRARTVRRTRSFLLMLFFPLVVVCRCPGLNLMKNLREADCFATWG
jgi:hypothetical protein